MITRATLGLGSFQVRERGCPGRLLLPTSLWVSEFLSLVIDAWQAITPPAPDEKEDKTTIRLYAAMLKKQNRQDHPFLIRYQDVEIDVDLAKETGRKDIVFFPCLDGDIYRCLEAKHLNVRIQ